MTSSTIFCFFFDEETILGAAAAAWGVGHA